MLRMTMVLLGMLLLAGGSVSAVAASTTPPAATVQAQRVHVIVIDKMQFGPMPTDVRAGDILEWTNKDILEHSATAREGSFDIDLKPGASARSVATAGTFAVFCKFHPTMTATLVVK